MGYDTAALLGPMYAAGTGMQMAGTLGKGEAEYAAGVSKRDTSEYVAKGYERTAGEERGNASRQSLEQRTKLADVTGKQRAIAAASGASGDSASILDILADTEARGHYLAKSEIAKGESKARGDEDKAAVARAEGQAAFERGKNARTGSIVEALAGGLKGAYGYDQTFGRRRRKVGYQQADEGGIGEDIT